MRRWKMAKIKDLDDCVSGRDYAEYFQRQGIEVTKNGSYFEYEKDGIYVRVPDSARCLPKETRSTINSALVKAGLLLVLLVGILAAVLL